MGTGRCVYFAIMWFHRRMNTPPRIIDTVASFDFFSSHQMTARSVLLAMAAASFLRGDEALYAGGDDRNGSNDSIHASSGNRTSLAQRWRECDQQAQLSLASANPQVRKKQYIYPPVAHFRHSPQSRRYIPFAMLILLWRLRGTEGV